jgi:hypothetical protein
MQLPKALFLALGLPAASWAYSAAPPLGHTGAPGEQTCRACHATFPLNSGNGSFVIEGPAEFLAGQPHTFTVRLQDPGQSRWGFQLTTRGVGTITLMEPARTQVVTSGGGIQYVYHTSAGTEAGLPDGPVNWNFTWTAPDPAPESVTFWAAGNAANNNGLNTGDYIYTTSLALPQAPPPPVTDLAITATAAAAHLSWSAVPTATGYRVERREGLEAAWTTLAQVSSPGHTDLGPGSRALYRVVAERLPDPAADDLPEGGPLGPLDPPTFVKPQDTVQ